MSLFSQSDAIFAVTIPTVPCSCPQKASINSPNFTSIHVGFLLNSISSILESKFRRKLDKFRNTVDFVPVTQFRHYRNENALPVNVRTVSQLSDHVTWSWCGVRFLSRHFRIIFQVWSEQFGCKNSSKVGKVSPYAYSTSLSYMPDWPYIWISSDVMYTNGENAFKC